MNSKNVWINIVLDVARRFFGLAGKETPPGRLRLAPAQPGRRASRSGADYPDACRLRRRRKGRDVCN
ncbi:MAG: hypothetical protein QM739_20220 [Propionivibrio sp.]